MSVIVAIVSDFVISKGLRSYKLEEFGTWHQIYAGQIDSDVVVLGSSRALRHISPAILSRQLDVSVFNLGHNGQHFPMQKVRFAEYLQFNPKPKHLLLALDSTSLHDRKTAFQYEQFLPWFHREAIVNAVSHYEGYSALDKWLPMYRYRGRGDLALTGIRHALGLESSEYNRELGFRGLDREWDGAFDDFVNVRKHGYEAAIDETVYRMLEAFVADRVREGINVIMVFTPEFAPAQRLCTNREDLVQKFINIATTHGGTFLDFSHSPLCEQKPLFYNSQHLNRNGAQKFSHELADELRNHVLPQSRGVTEQ